MKRKRPTVVSQDAVYLQTHGTKESRMRVAFHEELCSHTGAFTVHSDSIDQSYHFR